MAAAGPSGLADERIVLGVGNVHLLDIALSDLHLSDPVGVLDVVPVVGAGGIHLGQQGVLSALGQLVGADVTELIEVDVVGSLLGHGKRG